MDKRLSYSTLVKLAKSPEVTHIVVKCTNSNLAILLKLVSTLRDSYGTEAIKRWMRHHPDEYVRITTRHSNVVDTGNADGAYYKHTWEYQEHIYELTASSHIHTRILK